ncbi:piggyBac transposable element-derived protein 3-like [Ixodes scapularis]
MTVNPQKHRPCYEIFIIPPNPTAMMKIFFQALLAMRRMALAIHPTILTDQDQLEMYEYGAEILTPFQYFRQFFDRKMFEHLAEQTNLYSVQKSEESTNTDADEMEQFVGIFLMTGLIPFPQYHFYWNEKLQFTPVSQTMSKNRFKQLRRYFHAADNSKILPKGDPGFDSPFKLRPFLDALQEKCLAVAPEEAQSIVYQFAVYAGTDTLKRSQDYQLGFGGNIVMALCDDLPNASNFKVTFVNWFCSIELIEALKRRGIFSCGTISAKSNE